MNTKCNNLLSSPPHSKDMVSKRHTYSYCYKSFGEMTSKATDYLLSGVDRVWVVDNQVQSVTVFGGSDFPQTFWVNDTISDLLLPGLAISLTDIFVFKRPSNAN